MIPILFRHKTICNGSKSKKYQLSALLLYVMDLFCFFQIRDYIKKKTSLLTDFINVSNIEKQMFSTLGHTLIKVLYDILKAYTATGSQELR